MHCLRNFFLSRDMHRRESLRVTSKTPWLSPGTTRKFKNRRSRSTISSFSDVFADGATTRGQAGLSAGGMKLRSKKNLNVDEGRSAEVGPASETPTDPFEEGEQTLTRPDYLHHADLEEPGEDFEQEEVERTEEASERSEVKEREKLLLKGTYKSETKSNRWRKEQSSLVNLGKNGMMSSISPREEQTRSKAKRSFKAMYDERMRSLRTDGLSSGYDGLGLMHSDMDFTLSPRQEKSKKALSDSPTRPRSDGITTGVSSNFDKLMISMNKQKGGASSSTRLQAQLTSSSLDLTPMLVTAIYISDMFAGVMPGVKEL